VNASSLTIAGLTPLSTCDWPGHLVATVFLQGCPWRCTYCHNPGLLDPLLPGVVPWAEVRELLERRQGLLDGVVFSGGEPTRQDGLADAMRQVRELGFGVGLHTSGAYPQRLAGLLPLVDWVGLDVKAPSDRYAAVTGVEASAVRAAAALDLVLGAGTEVQVRTTVDPAVLSADDVARLTGDLAARGVADHVIQQARPVHRPEGT
jgi:pyruvate formate lyase activating enzyme